MTRVLLYAAAVLIGGGYLPFALVGLSQTLDAAVHQFSGPAVISDFLATYAGAFLWMHEPAKTYQVAAQLLVEATIQGGRQTGSAFLLPPYVLPVINPLGLLPYPAAYLLWLLAGVAATVLAAWLVAPRIGPKASWLLWVPVMLVLYFPVSFDLVMGQSASFMLLGLALLVRMPSSSMWRGALALAPIAFKPPLLPVYLVALLLARRWRLLVVLVALLTVLLLLAVSRIGTTALVDYAGLSQGKLQYTLDGPDEPNNYAPTLVRLFLWLFGPGSAALVATLVVSAGLWICTAWIWVRSGPSNDEQLLAWALLPLVSVLTASYAGMYEMSTWLLTTWLLLRYAAAKRAVAAPIGVVVLLLWAAANAAVLNNTMGNRVATLAGLVAVGVIIYSWVRSSSTSDVVALSPQSAS